MRVTATSTGPGLSKIKAGIAALNGSDVLVGIPEANSSRKGGGINNAELLFIFTNGSPLHGQPPRPVIEPAIEAEPTKNLIAKQLGMAASAALDGDSEGMAEHLDKAGTIGESASKRWFTDPRNNWAPNSPSTIRAKGSDTPGIDTAQMRRAITHVLDLASMEGSSEPEENTSDGSRDIGEGIGKSADNVGETVGKAAETVGEGVEAAAEAVGEGIVDVAEVIAL